MARVKQTSRRPSMGGPIKVAVNLTQTELAEGKPVDQKSVLKTASKKVTSSAPPKKPTRKPASKKKVTKKATKQAEKVPSEN